MKSFKVKHVENVPNLYSKGDVVSPMFSFEKFIKCSKNEIDINFFYCVGLPGFTYQNGLKYTGTNLQTLHDKELIFLIEKNLRGGFSSVMGKRFVKSNGKKAIKYMDSKNL